MSEKKRLSLCMITKNDEEHLLSCLENIKEIVDEIVIVDIGSKDSTIDIAKQAGANVYQMNWRNNYSEAKNFCLDKAKGRWVMFLQANETISIEQQGEIYSLLDDPNVEAYLIYIDNALKKNRIFSPVQSLRLHRNRKEYRYKYRVYERIPDEILNNIKDAGIRIVQQDNPDLPREDLSAALLKGELSKHPEDSYLQYIYGIELLNQQKYEDSVVYLQKACENVNYDYLFAPHLYKCLSWVFIFLQRYSDALKVLREGIDVFPFYTDLLVLRGEVRRQLQQYKEAIEDFENSLKVKGQLNSIVPKSEIDISTILEILGEIHEEVFNYQQALVCFRESYELDKTNYRLLYKIEELSKKANFTEVPKNLLKKVGLDLSVTDTESSLLHNQYLESVQKLMELENSQPLAILGYALWSREFMKELGEWIERMHEINGETIISDISPIQTPSKPNKDLLAFYHSLGLNKNSISESVLQYNDGDIICAGIHVDIGDFYVKAEKRQEALSAYMRGIQWNPIDSSAQEKLRNMFDENTSQCYAFLEKKAWILEGNWFQSKEDFINYITGFICFKNKQFEKTIASFLKIENCKNIYPIALAYIISSLWITGKEKEAEKCLKEQNKTAVFFLLFFRICKGYALNRLNEGLKKFSYSQLIKREKQRISAISFNEY